MKISSVTVLYNFNEDVIKNLKTYEKFVDEVILIDNSDEKKYYEKYKEDINKYTYISMNGNVGIAKALNEGIKYSKEKGYEWVLTMDQDTCLTTNIIYEYKNIINQKKDNKIVILSPMYIFDRRKTKKNQKIKEIEYVMQSANLLNIKKFLDIGTFKEEFFIDVVDYEFCLRARKKKYKIISCGNIKVIHNPGITKKTKFLNIKYGYCNKFRIYYQARNLLWTARKYKNIKMLAILFYKLIKIILFFDNKKQFLYYYFKGIKDCKQNKWGVVKINEQI